MVLALHVWLIPTCEKKEFSIQIRIQHTREPICGELKATENSLYTSRAKGALDS